MTRIRVLVAAVFFLSVPVTVSANSNCGQTIAQVMEIVKRKYPDQDHAWLNNFLGNWLSDGERIRLTLHERFKVKGYSVMFCPYNGNRFQVRYVDGGSVAGVARMLGRNRIEISQTMIGTLYLEREGSIQVRN